MEVYVEGRCMGERFPGSVTVCDREGITLRMNDKAAELRQYGGGS